jgi:hypothetical protein
MAQNGAAPDLNHIHALVAQGVEIPLPNFGLSLGAPVGGPVAVSAAANPSLLSSGSGAVVCFPLDSF